MGSVNPSGDNSYWSFDLMSYDADAFDVEMMDEVLPMDGAFEFNTFDYDAFGSAVI